MLLPLNISTLSNHATKGIILYFRALVRTNYSSKHDESQHDIILMYNTVYIYMYKYIIIERMLELPSATGFWIFPWKNW